jgi:hypothetical protein
MGELRVCLSVVEMSTRRGRGIVGFEIEAAEACQARNRGQSFPRKRIPIHRFGLGFKFKGLPPASPSPSWFCGRRRQHRPPLMYRCALWRKMWSGLLRRWTWCPCQSPSPRDRTLRCRHPRRADWRRPCKDAAVKAKCDTAVMSGIILIVGRTKGRL